MQDPKTITGELNAVKNIRGAVDIIEPQHCRQIAIPGSYKPVTPQGTEEHFFTIEAKLTDSATRVGITVGRKEVTIQAL